MNWLLIIEGSVSGIVAALLAWLIAKGDNVWDITASFQTTIMAASVFASVFIGLFLSIPTYIMEKKAKKAFNQFVSATITSLAFIMLAGVIFNIISGIAIARLKFPTSIIRFFWWTYLSFCISGCIGSLSSSYKTLYKASMGLTPAFIIIGTIIDQFFSLSNNSVFGFILLGGFAGISLSISIDLLKDAWLDENTDSFFVYRYYLDAKEFYIGKSNQCDISISSGPQFAYLIKENDTLHSVEVLEQNSLLRVNSTNIRFKLLLDGDIINVSEKQLIYHTRYARTRDILPQASSGTA